MLPRWPNSLRGAVFYSLQSQRALEVSLQVKSYPLLGNGCLLESGADGPLGPLERTLGVLRLGKGGVAGESQLLPRMTTGLQPLANSSAFSPVATSRGGRHPEAYYENRPGFRGKRDPSFPGPWTVLFPPGGSLIHLFPPRILCCAPGGGSLPGLLPPLVLRPREPNVQDVHLWGLPWQQEQLSL